MVRKENFKFFGSNLFFQILPTAEKKTPSLYTLVAHSGDKIKFLAILLKIDNVVCYYCHHNIVNI